MAAKPPGTTRRPNDSWPRSAAPRCSPHGVSRSQLHTADGLSLVGELALPPDRDPVATMVCLHPLPTHGGMMDSHVFRKASYRLPALAGLAVLRFNTRGTSSLQGTSDGSFDKRAGRAVRRRRRHRVRRLPRPAAHLAGGLVVRDRPGPDVRARSSRRGGGVALAAVALLRATSTCRRGPRTGGRWWRSSPRTTTTCSRRRPGSGLPWCLRRGSSTCPMRDTSGWATPSGCWTRSSEHDLAGGAGAPRRRVGRSDGDRRHLGVREVAALTRRSRSRRPTPPRPWRPGPRRPAPGPAAALAGRPSWSRPCRRPSARPSSLAFFEGRLPCLRLVVCLLWVDRPPPCPSVAGRNPRPRRAGGQLGDHHLAALLQPVDLGVEHHDRLARLGLAVGQQVVDLLAGGGDAAARPPGAP